MELEKWLTHRRVVIPGGRVRCPVTYTEQRNSRFQGLAANLAKDALTAVVYSKLPVKVHAFIHDSVLISVEVGDVQTPRTVADIMLAAAEHLIPGVRAGVEMCGPGESWWADKHAAEQSFYIEQKK